MKNDRLFVISVGLGVLVLVVCYLHFVFPAKITNDVIDSLRRDYSPGPYAPGFDLDQIDPKLWQQSPQAAPVTTPEQSPNWNQLWEASRR